MCDAIHMARLRCGSARLRLSYRMRLGPLGAMCVSTHHDERATSSVKHRTGARGNDGESGRAVSVGGETKGLGWRQARPEWRRRPSGGAAGSRPKSGEPPTKSGEPPTKSGSHGSEVVYGRLILLPPPRTVFTAADQMSRASMLHPIKRACMLPADGFLL